MSEDSFNVSTILSELSYFSRSYRIPPPVDNMIYTMQAWRRPLQHCWKSLFKCIPRINTDETFWLSLFKCDVMAAAYIPPYTDMARRRTLSGGMSWLLQNLSTTFNKLSPCRFACNNNIHKTHSVSVTLTRRQLQRHNCHQHHHQHQQIRGAHCPWTNAER